MPTCACALPAPKPVFAVDSCGCKHKAVCPCRRAMPQISAFKCCRVSPCGGKPKCFGKSAKFAGKAKKAALKAARKAKKQRKAAAKIQKKKAKLIQKQVKRDFKKRLRQKLMQNGVYVMPRRRRRSQKARKALGGNCCPSAFAACSGQLPQCAAKKVWRTRKVKLAVQDACGCRKLVVSAPMRRALP